MKFNLDDIAVRDIVPGFHGRFVHSNNMTFAYFNIDQDAAIPAHSHPHEQVVNVLEGELELVVDGIAHRLRPGNVYTITGNVSHSARAMTPCRVLDVFTPVREDFR